MQQQPPALPHMPNQLATAQIGRCGELLVQYKLLKHGIESASMTTDTGIDLVAYSPARPDALTIQVKANLKGKPGGGKGKPHLDWWIPTDSPANLIALVDLDTERVWLFTLAEIAGVAQQKPDNRWHFFMALDPTTQKRRDGKPVHDHAFESHLLKNAIHRIFFQPTAPVKS